MRNFIITVAGVLVGLFLGELFIVPLANRIDVDNVASLVIKGYILER